MLQLGSSVFRGRYTLVRLIQSAPESELWEARDSYGQGILVKAWHYRGARPSDEERALWNVELRHLFRLASLPGAEDHLVVLRDAGISRADSVFFMALSAPGLYPLDSALGARDEYPWLAGAAAPGIRAELWLGIRRLALGLIQLHEQQMLHRAISASAILVDPDEGPSTLRLGGFEWAVRVGGSPPLGVPPLPPSEAAYSFESDWLLFGVLAARLIAGVDDRAGFREIPHRLAENPWIFGIEKDLLQQLVMPDARSRLTHGYEVLQRVQHILSVLRAPGERRPLDHLALIAQLGPQSRLTKSIIDQDESISAIEIERQRQFVEADLTNARIIIGPQAAGRDNFILIGNRSAYAISANSANPGATPSWDLAYCNRSAEVRFSSTNTEQVDLSQLPIKVYTARTFFSDESAVRRDAVSWQAHLPTSLARRADQDDTQPLHDFFRVTNQVELLMVDAEIFAYETISSRSVDGIHEVKLRQMPRKRAVAAFMGEQGSLVDFLDRQRNEARYGDKVYLGSEDALDLNRRVPLNEFWTVQHLDEATETVVLRRPPVSEEIGAPKTGFVRAFGLFGQMSLIKRRKRAIDRLRQHSYLLRSLQWPDFSYLDTGEQDLPRPLDPDKLDEAKSAALHAIWRTRPIFALQGPPGTGKTTLVAHLLGEIFEEDPVAQVLVTAQAHAAVDVLREKVSKEFGGVAAQPLAVRLLKSTEEDPDDPDSKEAVARRMLQQAIMTLEARGQRTTLQRRWLEVAKDGLKAPAAGSGFLRDVAELVLRSAGITYCTTTAGDLAQLADSTQTFDWAIVEEAGKAHGFDLALPLQTGHRWLLIGDQDQLPPYRIREFELAVRDLDTTFEAIEELPGRAAGLADIELSLRWQRYDVAERDMRQNIWGSWLRFFSRLHRACARIKVSGMAARRDDSSPPLAAMLWQQHRMHPTIAGLISRAYYNGKIESMTVDATGNPLQRVIHPFRRPEAIQGRAITWLDTPWIGLSADADESRSNAESSRVEADAVFRFLDTIEATGSEKMSLAVLSPYRLQVSELARKLKLRPTPSWAEFVQDAQRQRATFAATVDSFQGNQADVVVVSLVRNNMLPPQRGLGFLREASRLNVLFSRAERLLVLVGSWDFFQRQLEDVPADSSQPLGHLRLAMEYLAESFANGTAVRLSASSLEPIS